ncbi:hypothetical protein ACCO45_010765 [Purpureocillium lilacinum]|uniref:Uncharacterized protein n=1 Tax=Purpureocillium lilacinum TaxID=33203 RepID=A0ACC4DHB3_PURLI
MPANEKKEYFCTFCKAEWTAMEVLDSVGPEGFKCHRCGHILTFEADRNSGGHEQSTRLNDQFKFISELLPKIDGTHPCLRLRPSVVQGAPGDSGRNTSTRGDDTRRRRCKQTHGCQGPNKHRPAVHRRKHLHVSRSVGGREGGGAASQGEDRAAERAAVVDRPSREVAEDAAAGKAEDGNTSARIDDIFAKLKAEQEAELARVVDDDEDDEFGSEEDGEDEFEDVPPTGNNSGLGTPGLVGLKRRRRTASRANRTALRRGCPRGPRSRRIHDTARLWFGASAVSSCRPSDENVVLVDRPLEEVLEIESICHMAKCRAPPGTVRSVRRPDDSVHTPKRRRAKSALANQIPQPPNSLDPALDYVTWPHRKPIATRPRLSPEDIVGA